MTDSAMADPTGIQRTLAAYCHTVDDGDFETLAGWFAKDAVVEVMGQRIEGRDAIQSWIADAMPAHRRGKHVTVNTRVDVQTENRAEVLSDFLFLARRDGGWEITQTGRYEDHLARAEDRWQFALRRIHLDGGSP